MNGLGLPASLETIAIDCGECARHLRAFGQTLVRPDLSSNNAKAVALASLRRLRAELTELESTIGQTVFTVEPYPLPAKDPSNGPTRMVRKRKSSRATE